MFLKLLDQVFAFAPSLSNVSYFNYKGIFKNRILKSNSIKLIA